MTKNLKLLPVILTLSIFGILQAAAQTNELKGRITGTVVDGNTKTIESATIALQRSKDSSVAKMSVADKTGKFEFDNIPAGVYFVSVAAVGHNKGFSDVFEINEANQNIVLKTIELTPQPKSIAGVTVTSKKPYIE